MDNKTPQTQWSWEHSYLDPINTADLPRNCLVFKEVGERYYYWMARMNGNQRDGGHVRGVWFSDPAMIRFVHELQILKGYGPVYFRNPDGTHCKVDLMIVGITPGESRAEIICFQPELTA